MLAPTSPPAPPTTRRSVRDGLLTTTLVSATVVSAAWRAAAAVAAGLVLSGGVALVLWAVTPEAQAGPGGLLGGSVTVYAAAHFLPVTVSSVPVTLRPLLLTVVAVGVIASSAGRGRMVRGRVLEALHVSVFVVGYALFVDISAAVLAPAHSVEPGLLAPLCVAAVGAALGLALHRTAWRAWWDERSPEWLGAAVRASAAAVCCLIAGGGLALGVMLIRNVTDAMSVTALLADSAGDAIGVLVLCLLLVPNAIVAAIGYVSGAGFSIGSAGYSPLAAHTAELPGIPLLAAVPGGHVSQWAWAAFLVPAIAAALVIRLVLRGTDTRRDRVLASASASVLAGVVVGGLAAAAGGGVAGGPWASTGVPVLLVMGLVAGVTGVLSVPVCAVAGWGTVPWTVGSEEHGEAEEAAADDEGSGGDAESEGSDESGGDSGPAGDTEAEPADNSEAEPADDSEAEPADNAESGEHDAEPEGNDEPADDSEPEGNDEPADDSEAEPADDSEPEPADDSGPDVDTVTDAESSPEPEPEPEPAPEPESAPDDESGPGRDEGPADAEENPPALR